jgi:hypothetical protein
MVFNSEQKPDPLMIESYKTYLKWANWAKEPNMSLKDFLLARSKLVSSKPTYTNCDFIEMQHIKKYLHDKGIEIDANMYDDGWEVFAGALIISFSVWGAFLLIIYIVYMFKDEEDRDLKSDGKASLIV